MLHIKIPLVSKTLQRGSRPFSLLATGHQSAANHRPLFPCVFVCALVARWLVFGRKVASSHNVTETLWVRWFLLYQFATELELRLSFKFEKQLGVLISDYANYCANV